jgi:hypothetical protein
MVKHEANIDVVFRNGLKDYEVLPPPDVWNNINPVLKTNPGSYLLFKAAAIFVVVLMMSFFAYRWTFEVSPGLDGSVFSLNEETAAPDVQASFINPVSVAAKANRTRQNYPDAIIENVAYNAIRPENEYIASPEIIFLHETNTFSTYYSGLMKGPQIANLNFSQKVSFEVEEPDLTYSQEMNTTKSAERWSIAAMASPTYYSRFSSGNSDVSKQLMASEQPAMSYSGGLAFSYKISKRVSVQSGLYYSSLGQEVDGINSFAGFQKYVSTKGDRNFEIPTSSGTIYTNNGDVFLIATGPGERIKTNYNNDVFDPKKASLEPLNNTIRQNFSYLELPVVVRYKIIDKLIDFNLIGGLSYNMLLDNTVSTMANGVKYSIGKTEGLNPISLSSSIGMGMEYNFSNKLSLNLEPTFRYYLNPFYQTIGSQAHTYSFGIFTGLSYKF